MRPPTHRPTPTLAPPRPAPPRRPPPRAAPPSVDSVLATVAALHPAWSARGCKLDIDVDDGTAPTPDTAAAALRAVATVAPRAGRGARGGGGGVPALLRDPRVAGLVQALRVGGHDGDSSGTTRLSPLRAVDALVAVGRLAAGTGGAHDAVLDGCLAVVAASSWAGVAPTDAAQVMAALAAACYAPPSALAAADAAVAAGAAGHPRHHARPLGTALWAGAVLQAAPAACLDRDSERVAAAALAAAQRGPKADAATARALWSLAALGRERGPAFGAALAALAAAAPRIDTLSLPTLTQLHVACTAARLAGAVLPATVADLVEDAAAAVAARAAKTATSSALQDSVVTSLTRLLGRSAVQREGVAPGVGLPVDALLPAARVAVEVDGPHHYVRVPSHQHGAPPTLRPDGRTALKTRLLQATGWTVLRVSGAEWDAAGASAEREAWLLQRLVECGAVAG